jgi:homogentisate 1,2-dioxygenase
VRLREEGPGEQNAANARRIGPRSAIDVASPTDPTFCVSGKFGSRRGVDVGSITLHPSGLRHGPQPGLAEKSIGTHETHEPAVMCDTFHPLKLTKFAKDLDDGKYAYSW